MPTGNQYLTANERAGDDSLFDPTIEIMGKMYFKVPKRYGDNPHQACCLYVPVDVDFQTVGSATEEKSGKQGLSMTNTRDIDRACRILKYMREVPACAVMKHLNPAGVARYTKHNPRRVAECFRDAWDGDPVAAFGSAVVFTKPVDKETAGLIQDGSHYVEVVAAPDFEEGVMGIFESARVDGGKKKVNPSMRVVTFQNLDKLPRYQGDPVNHMEIVTNDDGSLFIQEPYLTMIRSPDDTEVVTKRVPTEAEYDDMLSAWYVTQGLRSNGVALWRDGQLLAGGTGQQERVRSIRYAVDLVKEKGHSTEGSVLGSDGYIPMRDNIDKCAENDIKAIIEPGESMADKIVISACDENDIAMVFTKERCFSHH